MLSFVSDHMLTLMGRAYIRTFILIHFYSDYSRRRATVCVQNCTNLTLPLYFVSFVSLLFPFFFSLHTGEHTKNGNKLHMI